MDVAIAPDRAALVARAADLLATELAAAVAAHGRCAVALAGGATPRPVYERLARPPYRERIPWAQVHVFWGDERCVPRDHPASNTRLIEEALLARVPIPPANVHRMPVERGAPETVAAAYEANLRAFFSAGARGAAALCVPHVSPSPLAESGAPGTEPERHVSPSPPRGEVVLPRFDVIMLGMGADGHTASLFPGNPALDERQRWVIATVAPQPPHERVTLTLPVLNAARLVVFLVAGSDKAGALRAVLADRSTLPAARVRPVAGRLVWLVDEAAAHTLSA